MQFEILAPAGSWDALVAGVRCGANAVYLGGKSLSARRNAGNFNDEELERAAEYCSARGVKIHLAVNTLCKDCEFEDAYDLVSHALSCGVDGFIVQDLGIAQMIRNCFPQARLHASTQTSVMTSSGVAALKELGFSRVVLPREMSFDEIKEISDSTDMELEMFVHGALCMSVSGQCYMSAMIGQRSGNRGLCAQTCRLPFSACSKGRYVLSLKDLSLIERLAQIDKLGVMSLKIEGRMKRPEYVAAAVTAVREAVEGSYSQKTKNTLQSVFSRNGFTSGYFDGKTGADMFGIRNKEDVVAASSVLKELSHLYDNENPLVKLDMDFEMHRGRNAVLTAHALGKTAVVTGCMPEEALRTPLTEESIRARLSKLGGTQFYAGNISADIDDGLILSASAINDMRRRAVESLSEYKSIKVDSKPLKIPAARESSCNQPYFTARFANAEQIPESHPFKRVFLPVWAKTEDFVKYNAGAELPRGLFGCEKRLRDRLAELKQAGVEYALCGNIGSLNLASDMGFDVCGDFGLNVFNSTAADLIPRPILSFELTVSEANRVNSRDTGIIVYGKLPLMLTRNCPVKNTVGCEKCGRNGFLKDRKGKTFQVVCSPYPCVEILNSVPVYLADKMSDVKTDFAHFYFTDENAVQVKKIISMYENKSPADFEFTRGLYYRGVF